MTREQIKLVPSVTVEPELKSEPVKVNLGKGQKHNCPEPSKANKPGEGKGHWVIKDFGCHKEKVWVPDPE